MPVRLLCFIVLAVAAVAAPPVFAQAAGPIAVVNGVAIPAASLDRAMVQARAAGIPDTPELRTALRTQLVARELFRQAAEAKGLARDVDVQSAAQEARDNAMIQRYLREAVKPRPVAEADLRARYDAIVASLGREEYRVRVIQTESDATARLVIAELKSGRAFDDLARQYSRAPSAAAGGLLDWVSFKTPPKEGATQGFPLPLAEAMLKLKPGMVTAEPVPWNNVYFVLRVEEARPTQVPPFEQVQPSLRQTFERQEFERATAELVASLLKNAKIEQ